MGVEKVEFLEADTKIKETKDKKNAKAFNALPEHIRVQTLHNAEKLYRQRAEAFEFGLAKKAETNKEILKQADAMLEKLKMMADAWAESTGQTVDQVYETSFAGSSKALYYGAIKGTASNVKQIFENAKSMPLRLKYGLLYRCILTGTFTKWMKTLALQIINSEMEVVSKKGDNEERSKNFIGALQKKDKNILMSLGLLKKEQKGGLFTEQLKDILKGINKDKSKKGVYKFGREGVLNQAEASKQGHKIRSENYSNLTKKDGIESFGIDSLRHLREDELSTPLTSMERETLGANGVDSEGVIQGWTQGAEDNSLIHGTDITKQVNEFKARVVAGTSGTTDLMIHAFQYFGLKPKEKKTLRMGLVGWMVGGRDHSFHEIFTAAEGYGEELKFNHDLSFIGSEYEDKDNLSPISQSDAKKILPDKEFPSYAYTPKSLVNLSSTNTFQRFKETKDESEQKQKYINSVYRRLGLTTEEEREQLSVPLQSLPYMDALLLNMKYLVVKYGIKKGLEEDKYEIYAKRLNREIKLDMNYIHLANTLEYSVFFEKFYKKVIKQLRLPSNFESLMLENATKDKNETEAIINPTTVVSASKTKSAQKQIPSTPEVVAPPPGVVALPAPPPPPGVVAKKQVSPVAQKENKSERYSKAIKKFEDDLKGNFNGIKLQLLGASARQINDLKSDISGSIEDKYCYLLKWELEKLEKDKEANNKNNEIEARSEEIKKEIQQKKTLSSKAADLISKIVTIKLESDDEKAKLIEELKKIDAELGGTYCLELIEIIDKYEILNDFEKKSLHYYTNQGYLSMNKLKSSKKKLGTEEEDKVDVDQLVNDTKATEFLTSALEKMPKFEGTVYRVSGSKTNFPVNKDGEFLGINNELLEEKENKAKSKEEIRLKTKKKLEKRYLKEDAKTSSGFTSTAYDTDSSYINTNWAKSGVLSVIKVTKDKSKGVNIDAMSGHQGEHEVLFPPGTKFKVTEVKEPKEYKKDLGNKNLTGHIVLKKELV